MAKRKIRDFMILELSGIKQRFKKLKTCLIYWNNYLVILKSYTFEFSILPFWAARPTYLYYSSYYQITSQKHLQFYHYFVTWFIWCSFNCLHPDNQKKFSNNVNRCSYLHWEHGGWRTRRFFRQSFPK